MAQSVRTTKAGSQGMGPGLVGLQLKNILSGGLFTTSRNWQQGPKVSKHQNTEDERINDLALG